MYSLPNSGKCILFVVAGIGLLLVVGSADDMSPEDMAAVRGGNPCSSLRWSGFCVEPGCAFDLYWEYAPLIYNEEVVRGVAEGWWDVTQTSEEPCYDLITWREPVCSGVIDSIVQGGTYTNVTYNRLCP